MLYNNGEPVKTRPNFIKGKYIKIIFPTPMSRQLKIDHYYYAAFKPQTDPGQPIIVTLTKDMPEGYSNENGNKCYLRDVSMTGNTFSISLPQPILNLIDFKPESVWIKHIQTLNEALIFELKLEGGCSDVVSKNEETTHTIFKNLHPEAAVPEGQIDMVSSK